ncbi:hypothetical protein ANN_27722 [Periplaneta americana]|uniref:Uncharacterized protein n=1 Tax=Periplaneta americana TaxID=6978 RepID=A0ABQ8RV15_PERAM|nr:hypothetical protein ANN_27722 [Periplaneta americana]
MGVMMWWAFRVQRIAILTDQKNRNIHIVVKRLTTNRKVIGANPSYCICVVMDVIKKESEVDPLAMQWSDETDRAEKKPIPECAVSSTQKFLVQQHITTSKHQANKQLNSKQRQLFLTQPTTSNVRSEFNIDLCRSLISADIPLYKLKNKVFREFLEKYTQHTIPDESTLRKTYAPSIYDETIQKIRDEIKDSSIWVSIDETPDKEVAMDVIKKESEVDPLAMKWNDETDRAEKKPIPEEENLFYLHVAGVKTESVDTAMSSHQILKLRKLQCQLILLRQSVKLRSKWKNYNGHVNE